MRLFTVCGLGFAMALTGQSYAGELATGPSDGIYQLHNHDAGNERPPGYGLRLDELIDVSDAHDIFTFDFDHELSDVRMLITDDFISIKGMAYGGLNEGNDYAADWVGVWDFQFTYRSYSLVDGDDDLMAIGPAPDDHFGIIAPTFVDDVAFWLQDEAGEHPYSFRLGDEDDDLGHRGYEGTSGWGWLNHAPYDGVNDNRGGNDIIGPSEIFPHSYSSDWLFTVGQPIQGVPEPGTAALLGLASLAMLRRRR